LRTSGRAFGSGPSIREIDLNPVIAYPTGQGAPWRSMR